jgi:hypothetical protein
MARCRARAGRLFPPIKPFFATLCGLSFARVALYHYQATLDSRKASVASPPSAMRVDARSALRESADATPSYSTKAAAKESSKV